MLKIFVLIKQVPRLKDLRIDHKTGTILRDDTKNIINPDDLYGIELGLNLKERYGGEVTVVTMGPPQADSSLREALAMGVDKAIHISDPVFAYSDTLQTTLILKETFDKIKDYDLIITGSKTSDSSTGQVPYQLSEALDIPLITHIYKIDIDGKTFKCQRNFGHESQNIKCDLPVLIRVVPHSNEPRHVSLLGIKKAYEQNVVKIDFNALNCPAHIDGCNKSPTNVVQTVKIQHERKHEFIEGTVKEKTEKIILLLKEYGIDKIWTGNNQ
ncbi:MAG: electron transfer flavoprotein subunit beta/FixA family protein [Promethearchaeota archaeon]